MFRGAPKPFIGVALFAMESALCDLETLPLLTRPFVLVVSAGHSLARRKRVTAKHQEGERVLLLVGGPFLRARPLAVCDTTGACDLRDFRATSLATLVQMLEAGVGITMLPAMAVIAGHRRGDGLCLVRFGAPVPSRTVAPAWQRPSLMRGHFDARALVSA